MKKYSLLISVALVFVFLISVVNLVKTRIEFDNEYTKVLSEARRNREEKVYTDAVAHYNEAYQRKPSVDLMIEIIEFFIEAKDEGGENDSITVLTENYPKETKTYDFLSKYYYNRGEYDALYSIYSKMRKRGVKSDDLVTYIQKSQYEYFTYDVCDELRDYTCGMCPVLNKGLWGGMNNSGAVVTPCKFKQIGLFDGQLIPVVDLDDEVYLANHLGDRKVNIKIEGVTEVSSYLGGIYTACVDGKWGFYRNDFSLIVGGFDDASCMCNGFSAVLTNGKWRIIKPDGTWLNDEEYEEVSIDERNILCNQDRFFGKQNGKFYLYNKEGNKVTNDSYDSVCSFNSSGYAAVCNNGKWGFIDTNGKIVIDYKYENAKSFNNGYAPICKDGLWGYMDEKETIIVLCQYSDAKSFNSAGNAFVKIENEWHILKFYSKQNY